MESQVSVSPTLGWAVKNPISIAIDRTITVWVCFSLHDFGPGSSVGNHSSIVGYGHLRPQEMTLSGVGGGLTQIQVSCWEGTGDRLATVWLSEEMLMLTGLGHS